MGYWKSVLIYLAAVVLGGHMLDALAAAEDDYREGASAYQRADMSRAASLLKKAADAGHAPAQALFGTVMEKSGENEEGFKYYRMAADQGNANGAFALGMMFLNGIAVKRDVKQASNWIARAGEKGHQQAVNVLAETYMKGEGPLLEGKPEPEQVLLWARRAADNNYLPAVDFLARAYRNGALGLTADAKQAERYDARAKELRGIADKPKTKARK